MNYNNQTVKPNKEIKLNYDKFNKKASLLITLEDIDEENAPTLIIPSSIVNHYRQMTEVLGLEVNAIHKCKFNKNFFYMSKERYIPKQVCSSIETERNTDDYVDYPTSEEFKIDLHTHPQGISDPSATDWEDWNNRTKFIENYSIFVIVSMETVKAFIYYFRGLTSTEINTKMLIDTKDINQLYLPQYKGKLFKMPEPIQTIPRQDHFNWQAKWNGRRELDFNE